MQPGNTLSPPAHPQNVPVWFDPLYRRLTISLSTAAQVLGGVRLRGRSRLAVSCCNGGCRSIRS
jgi:hypothetical protein